MDEEGSGRASKRQGTLDAESGEQLLVPHVNACMVSDGQRKGDAENMLNARAPPSAHKDKTKTELITPWLVELLDKAKCILAGG